jgi:hypothetical protein
MCSTSQAQELECHCWNRRYATSRCQLPDLEITHVLLQAGRVAALDELSDSVLARQQPHFFFPEQIISVQGPCNGNGTVRVSIDNVVDESTSLDIAAITWADNWVIPFCQETSTNCRD